MTQEQSAIAHARGVPLAWQTDLSGLPVHYVTEFLLQLDGDGLTAYLTVGIAPPPVVLGDSEAQQAQVEQITSVPIQPVARFAMPRAKFDALVAAARGLPSAEQFRELVEKAKGAT